MLGKAIKHIDFNFKPTIFNKITYWFKRKKFQLKKLKRYVPVLWKSFDFDYHYAIDLFQMQLEDIATHLESKKAMTTSSKKEARKMRTILKLMKKVYDEDYALEYQDRVEAKFGKSDHRFEELDEKDEDGKPLYEMIASYNGIDETEEIRDYVTQELHISRKKQERAHKLLWTLIEHNIQGWWD